MKTEMFTGKLHWKIIDGVHYGKLDAGRSEAQEQFAQVFRGAGGYRLFIKNHQVGTYRNVTRAKRKAEELA